MKFYRHISSDKAWSFWFLPTIWVSHADEVWCVGFRWLAWSVYL